MRVSIVLTLYNGMEFLHEQLDSLKNQDYPVDEIIICDDLSTDDSYIFVEEYIKNNSLSHWKLYKNTSNLGWKVNFWNAFFQATGDIIFPCDQDDIWMPNKISKMVDVMKNENIDLLVSDYLSFTDSIEKIRRSGHIRHTSKVDSSIYKLEFNENFSYVLRPGCTFGFRKRIVEELNEYWDSDFPHDALLWRYSIIKGTLYWLKEETMYYRRHINSATNPDKTKSVLPDANNYFNNLVNKTLSVDLEFYSKLYKKLDLTVDLKYYIEKNYEFNCRRLSYLKNKNFLSYFDCALRNKSFYYSNKSILGDLYLLFFAKRRF